MGSTRTTVCSILVLFVSGSAAALAEENNDTRAELGTIRHSTEILARMDHPEGDRSWLSHHLDHIHIHKKTGLEYRRPFSVGERSLELRVRGPALKMKHKRLGMSFEVRF